jgi:hypothetical protein
MTDYSVCDMGAVAFLLCKGFRHSALTPTGNRGQLAFVFTDPAAREEVTNYFCGATVKARDFSDALRAAKALLYERKEVCHKSREEFAK